MAEKKNIVTIDGPSGAGKSTISKLLAARLRYTYLDTGAMYRVVGLQVERAGLELEAEGAREKLTQLLADLDMALAPGEEGILTVEFDPNLHEEPEGKFFKTIAFLTDPVQEERVELRIWAQIDLDLGPDAYKLKGHKEEDEDHEEDNDEH